jgi:hypothetical protein
VKKKEDAGAFELQLESIIPHHNVSSGVPSRD